MSNSSISIVLPVYNGTQYLRQSVQSVLDQTHQNWELLIIDDCSTDATPQIISEYCSLDPRIKSVRHEKNKRLPGSLNTGFHLAAGEYVTWTSDDNIYRPNALQEMADVLDENKDISFVHSDFDLIDEDGSLIEPVSAGDWKNLGLTDVIGGSFLYRRIIHETIGYYDETTFLAEDLEFELRALVNGFKFMPLHKNLYQYRDHPDSLTNTKAGKIYRAHADVLMRHFPRMTWMSQDTKSRSFLHLARKAFHVRDFSAANKFLFEGFRLSPFFAMKNLLLFPIVRKISE
jgi:glycosyltransferase involved in cell wall biosynthesis